MKQIIYIGLTLILFSCSQTEISDIEVIKFDYMTIDELMRKSDTSYIENIGRAEFYTADYYINYGDSVTTKICKDSSNNVVAVIKSKNEKIFFVREYYPNGQVMGKLPKRINGEYNGKARYYHQDGRVSSEGQFLNGHQSGNWKNYNKDGRLISIEDYADGNINPIKTTKIE